MLHTNARIVNHQIGFLNPNNELRNTSRAGNMKANMRQTNKDLISRYSSIPCTPLSRPLPDIL